MAQKHLHQLLQEDQEPFFLTNYIANRKLNLHLDQPKKLPVSRGFRKRVCFLAHNNSPDLRNAPLFEFRSPTADRVFHNVPERTASLLLEAALRIQKPCSSSSKDKKAQVKSLFSSLFKRITNRNKLSERDRGVRSSVKDVRERKSFVDKSAKEVINRSRESKRSGYYDAQCSCSCNGRTSGMIWSESSEEKSMDLDMSFLSISGRYLEDQEEQIRINAADAVINEHYVIGDSYDFDNNCCANSPFNFVLQRSPCFGYRTLELASPAMSPSQFKIEGKDDTNEKEEQCSPVSVLDPTFEDDDDHDQMEDHGNFNMECSYAIVQEVKNQLLQKLLRFEKLAELDPVELEKLMLEAEDKDNIIDYLKAEACCEEEEKEEIDNVDDTYVVEEVSKSRKIRSVRDVVDEEKSDVEQAAKRVWRRLEAWKEVEFNTVEMMVEQDMRRDDEEWKRSQEEIALEIELRTLGVLMDELIEDLQG